LGVNSSHLSLEGFGNQSLKPGGSVSLTLSDTIVNIVLDKAGDWTITVGVSSRSDRLGAMKSLLGNLGFFQGTESDGMLYFLWTSALLQSRDSRSLAEDTLVHVLKSVESSWSPTYIS
jgi:hypothetical protein